MHILVIGGAGYIGSHVVLALKEAGHHVRIFDNLSSGQKINMAPDADFIQGDILDMPALMNALDGMDAVIHLAAKKAVGESMEHPEIYAQNNIVGTLNILNAMAQKKVHTFVFSSSAAVYGMPDKSVLDENIPTRPINFYGFTKLEIERFLDWYDRLKGIKFIALRYFNAVGYDEHGRVKGLEQNPQNLLPIIMETAVGKRPEMAIFGTDYDTPDGTCVRDYIHVSDLADAHVRALNWLKEKKTSRIFNLGTGSGHSVLSMVTRSRALTGKPIPCRTEKRRAGDPACLTACANRAHAELGWSPTHSDLDNIILSTWHVYHTK